jgi:siderophore synthetase component
MSEDERHLTARLLTALLREDYAGLARRVSPDGAELRLPGLNVRLTAGKPGADQGPAGCLRPVAVAWMLAQRVVEPRDAPGLAELLRALRLVADPRDDLEALERECRAELSAVRLHGAVRERVLAGLVPGPAYYDVLAAFGEHPVYPLSRARPGLDEAELRAYAPEFGGRFELRWTRVPVARVTVAGERPGWWPVSEDPAYDLFPVHPLTAARIPLDLEPAPYLEVTPTLSMRTVCVVADPGTHLKLPLPTATLGRRNRRSIVPRTLADGAAVQRILAGIPGLPVVLADEQTYGHAGDEHLGYLVRRVPAGTVVPVAALLARTPSGRTVIEELAPDVGDFFDRYLRLLFALNVRLFTAYGIALETHQQNLSLVLGPEPRALLVKDNDGALVHPDHPGAAELADRRMVTADPEALARMFVTITLHLCAGAIAFGLADRGLLPLAIGLRMVRDRLGEALDSADGPRAAILRARTLDADRLATKAMLTAGTLVGKDRTGAADINKHYGPSGPNYLRGIAPCLRHIQPFGAHAVRRRPFRWTPTT